jgi:hypothetical protein
MDTELISMTSGLHRTAGSTMTQAGQKSLFAIEVVAVERDRQHLDRAVVLGDGGHVQAELPGCVIWAKSCARLVE